MADRSATPKPAVRQMELRPAVFQALSDPTRLALIVRLATAAEPKTVTELTSCCGVHLSGVSRHLASLREVGLLRAERRGREVRYQLEHEVLTGTLRGLADAIDSCVAGRCEPQIECKRKSKTKTRRRER